MALAEDLLADDDAGVELLLVVGSLLADAVLGRPERRAGRHLLQARLPVESGPERGGLLDERVEVVVHEARGEVDVGREEDGADERLEGVGQDRGLVAAAGRLLALAEHDVLPEVEDAGDVGEGAHVDDGRAQLGQLPLGQVGVLAVERLGDDETQHGVAEELEALVVGQAAVLVGVRAVRQGTQEQRLVDVLADHLTEVGDQSIDGPLRHRRNTPSARSLTGLLTG